MNVTAKPQSTILFLFLMIFMLAGSTQYSSAQTEQISISDQKKIQEELAKRNITEAELRTRLREKGINIDNISPGELPNYQGIIMETVRELEEENKQESGESDSAPETPQKEGTEIEKEKTSPDKTQQAPKEKESPSNIYGHNIFVNETIDFFNTTDGARAPDNYVLGPGDQIRINIFGESQTDMLLEINEEGYVRPAETPQIYLKGITIAQARNLLQRRLSKYYSFRANQFSLSMHTARTITVNVFGEVSTPGSYNVSALNTAFNVIAAAGGVKDIGSVREIQHISDGESQMMDVYAFMNDPSIKFDYALENNDIIYIPVADKTVDISGAVKRPMRYELKKDETLKDLIEFAGGINYDTDPNFIQIERIVDGEVMLEEHELDKVLEGDKTIQVKNGDKIRLRKVDKPLKKYVEVEGAVFYPGQYDLRKNSNLQTLLNRSQIKPEAKTDLIFIERQQNDNSIDIIPVEWKDNKAQDTVKLKPEDKILVFEKERYRNLATLKVTGNVRETFARNLPYNERISLAHALALAGGANPTAAETGYVVRRNLMNPEKVKYIPVNIVEDWEFMLQPGDELRIYDKSTYTNIPQISVQGAVNNSLTTKYDDELTVKDLLTMAGGLTEKASHKRIDVFRLNLDVSKGTSFDVISLEVDSNYSLVAEHEDFYLMPYDQVVVRQIPMFDTDRNVQINGEVMYPGSYPLETGKTRLSDLVKQAGGTTDEADLRNATLIRSFQNTGPVGINLGKALDRSSEKKYDPIIMEGDVVSIPKFNNVVSIRLHATRLGELKARGVIPDAEFVEDTTETGLSQQSSKINLVYQGPRSAKWYIENYAGGLAKEADKRSIMVTHPNGQVEGTKRRLFIFNDYPNVQPGSTISLGFEPPPPPEDEDKVDWEQLHSRTMQATTTFLSLMVLVNQLSK
ncbi:MAG: SLBB domain-containing protein [Bacteroidales bacterium]|nr:SLBB domain-containing protein [Bacteroidales bacterium]